MEKIQRKVNSLLCISSWRIGPWLIVRWTENSQVLYNVVNPCLVSGLY